MRKVHNRTADQHFPRPRPASPGPERPPGRAVQKPWAAATMCNNVVARAAGRSLPHGRPGPRLPPQPRSSTAPRPAPRAGVRKQYRPGRAAAGSPHELAGGRALASRAALFSNICCPPVLRSRAAADCAPQEPRGEPTHTETRLLPLKCVEHALEYYSTLNRSKAQTAEGGDLGTLRGRGSSGAQHHLPPSWQSPGGHGGVQNSGPLGPTALDTARGDSYIQSVECLFCAPDPPKIQGTSFWAWGVAPLALCLLNPCPPPSLCPRYNPCYSRVDPAEARPRTGPRVLRSHHPGQPAWGHGCPRIAVRAGPCGGGPGRRGRLRQGGRAGGRSRARPGGQCSAARGPVQSGPGASAARPEHVRPAAVIASAGSRRAAPRRPGRCPDPETRARGRSAEGKPLLHAPRLRPSDPGGRGHGTRGRVQSAPGTGAGIGDRGTPGTPGVGRTGRRLPALSGHP
ncbi:translation initiation factor IF-2-like [Onychomys torridus]|uniref:translation initiation factor IF-2-like n=1 Tax=Onychomys torridus TaxID=38674 RepID=UPI00167F44C9|nr:translation initiation factor IF-2-like [Onychomys torridus]